MKPRRTGVALTRLRLAASCRNLRIAIAIPAAWLRSVSVLLLDADGPPSGRGGGRGARPDGAQHRLPLPEQRAAAAGRPPRAPRHRPRHRPRGARGAPPGRPRASPRATRCRPPSGATPRARRELVPRSAPLARRLLREAGHAGGLRDRPARGGRAAALQPGAPAGWPDAGRGGPRRDRASAEPRAAAPPAGRTSWIGPRAATTTWRSWAGRRTPPTRTTSSPRSWAPTSIGATNRSRYRSPAMDGLLKQGRRGGDQRERAGDLRGRRRRCSSGTCRGSRSTMSPSSPPTGGASAAWPSAPRAPSRFDKVWKTP